MIECSGGVGGNGPGVFKSGPVVVNVLRSKSGIPLMDSSRTSEQNGPLHEQLNETRIRIFARGLNHNVCQSKKKEC